jgi:hypothetical protein
MSVYQAVSYNNGAIKWKSKKQGIFFADARGFVGNMPTFFFQ